MTDPWETYKKVADEAISNMIQTDDDTFIICAGWMRTATSSLQIALANLGYRVYHARDMMKNQHKGDRTKWIKCGKLKYKLKKTHNINSFKPSEWNKCIIDYNWDEIFEFKNKKLYQGCVDTPSATFYADIMKYYSPNYKVILLIRDNADQWYKSYMKSIAPYRIIMYSSWFLLFMTWWHGGSISPLCECQLLWDGKKPYYGEVKVGKYVKMKYNDWIEGVKLNVPKDKLLVFNVKDGWEPLCKFLNKPVPTNKPFPRSNDGKTMKIITKKMQRIKLISDVALTIVVGSILAYVVKNKFY